MTRLELRPGERASITVIEDLPRTLMVQYAGASGDYNPLHTDERYAREVAGFPTVLAHGMLTMGLTGKALTDLVGDGTLMSFSGRFLAQVWPGDSLSVEVEVTSMVETERGPGAELQLSTTNQDGTAVFLGLAIVLAVPV